MLSSASIPIAVRVSIVAAPMCGSRNVFFNGRYPGFSFGSPSYVSKPTAATCYDAECPVIVAGDLNTDASKAAVALQLARAGFQDAVASSRSTPTTPAHGLFEGGRQIDWAFVRGPLRANSGHVHGSVNASDHLHAD